ncbi:MAG: sigma-70 family RNA polymerase sigma factor [Magnetovibrio sp.]|nr:sigma-70 family RNA polymerase sigma factor [Magnetovibrio sp.]
MNVTSVIDEAALVDALRAGSDDAFAQLVRSYGGRMLAVARRIVGEDEAGDCVQEAFLQAFRKIGAFRGDAKLATWLHRIVVNAALTRRRRRQRRPEVSLDSLMPVFDDLGCRVEPSLPLLDAPDLAASAEVRSQVLDALGQLPEDARQIILMRDLQGLDTAEAAAELGISDGAAKVRLHRARAALKRLLEPVFGGEPAPGTGDDG